MPLTQKYKKISLSNDEYFNSAGEKTARVIGEPRRILDGKIDIDYACFKKSKTEKEILKLAKNEAMKRY